MADGTPIPEMVFNKSMIAGRTISLYGPSGTGKTVVTKYLMDLLRGKVDQCIIVSPTEPSNHSFENYAPSLLIHTSMTAQDPKFPKDPKKRIGGIKGAEAFLINIWKRQEMLKELYENSHNLGVLLRLFRRTTEKTQQSAKPDLDKLAKSREEIMSRLTKKYRNNRELLRKEVKKIKADLTTLASEVYRRYINQDYPRLHEMRERLPKDERWALQYLNMRPGLVLVFDDCASDLTPLKNKPIFKKLFYQNRHIALTVIFAFQDDTDLAANFRKNSFVSIFCTDIICSAFFAQQANRFPKQVKTKVEELLEPIYARKYQMLAYMRDDPRGVNYYRFMADPPQEKMFPSQAVIDYCRSLQASNTNFGEDNPFSLRFALT